MSKLKALIHSWIVAYAYWNCKPGVYGFKRWFREQLTYYIIDFNVSNDGNVYRMELLGFSIDFRKWFIHQNRWTKEGFDTIPWYSEQEILNNCERNKFYLGPWTKVPWYIQYSHIIQRWRFRRPMEWFVIGWTIRAFIQ